MSRRGITILLAFHLDSVESLNILTRMTNREFYKGIEGLLRKQTENAVSLEQYLISFWFHASGHKVDPGLSLSDFYKLLMDSFTPVGVELAMIASMKQPMGSLVGIRP